MNTDTIYNCSFRCYYPSDGESQYSLHYQRMKLSDVPTWIEAYRFTHPSCISVICKVWFSDNGVTFQSANEC